MPRGVKKEHLPEKTCVICKRPFTWRKKWERCWDEVTTCSKSCNRKRKEASRVQAGTTCLPDNDTTATFGHVAAVMLEGNADDDDSDGAFSEAQSHASSVEDQKAARKAAKKAKKAARRAQREGRGDPSAGQKQCDKCGKSVDLLIRCTYEESLAWKMVCGKCWNDVSGGVTDGDADHPHYRYGGLWKNRRAQK